jgi:hypothetical protein
LLNQLQISRAKEPDFGEAMVNKKIFIIPSFYAKNSPQLYKKCLE